MSTCYDNFPLEMRAYPHWVAWRYEDRGGSKLTKVPVDPKTGYNASVTNPETWATFEQARYFADNNGCGIGFLFNKDDSFTGIDLDNTHGDPAASALQEAICREFGSYTERSPSGTGLHIIVKGTVPCGRRRDSVEVYSEARFFTMTGNVINNVPIAERQELLDTLFEQIEAAKRLSMPALKMTVTLIKAMLRL